MTIYAERVARKQHHCGWECGSSILPGQAYVRAAIPPGREPNYGNAWWVMVLHGREMTQCPTYVGVQQFADPNMEALS